MAFRYLILFVCVVCMGCSPSVPPGPIVLGHLNPASGDEEMQGIALAVEQMNGDPKKHVLGRKIKVIHAELGSSPDEAQAQTVRLLTVDKVDALFGANRWSQAEKMGMAAQSPSTVAMSFNGYAGSPAIAALFPVGVAPVERGRALARYLKEALKGSKAVVLKETDSLIAGIVARSFVGQCGNCSEYTLKGTDSLDFIKDLEQMKPDCILLCGSARSVLAWRAKLPAIPLLFGGEEAEIALFQSEGDFAKPIIAAVSFHPMGRARGDQRVRRQLSWKIRQRTNSNECSSLRRGA